MAINNRVGSGVYFVRFAGIGLALLFASVIFLKSTNIAGSQTAIVLGATIFLINCELKVRKVEC